MTLFLLQVLGSAPNLRGIFTFNYSGVATPARGLSASALVGMEYALPNHIRGERGVHLYLLAVCLSGLPRSSWDLCF
jgi:hypothetical protein